MERVYLKYYGNDSYGIIYKNKDETYSVYEIAEYGGGEEQFQEEFTTLEEAINFTNSLT